MADDLCRASFQEYKERDHQDKHIYHYEYQADKILRHRQVRIAASGHDPKIRHLRPGRSDSA